MMLKELETLQEVALSRILTGKQELTFVLDCTEHDSPFISSAKEELRTLTEAAGRLNSYLLLMKNSEHKGE